MGKGARYVFALSGAVIAAFAWSQRSDAIQAMAASAPDPVGDWTVAPESVGGLRIAIHISRQSGALSGTIDVPDQGRMNVPLSGVTADGADLAFDVPASSGHYAGAWNAARQAYVGQWTSPSGGGPIAFTRGKLLPPAPIDWNAPADPGLSYAPAAAAKAKVGPTLPVGKCVNLSNTLEAPKEGDWGATFQDDDFRIISKAGFRTVRIPVRWSTHAQATPPYTIDPAFLARVHHVVDLAIASRLNVILNVHHYQELMTEPAGNADRFAGIWRQVAASFASAPASVWFELLNEPENKLNDSNLPAILRPALAAVRVTNPTRPVLIGGQSWSSLASLDTLKLPDDPYVVPTFHYYEPFAFSSQGADWMPNPPPFGRTYGSAADKKQLDADLQRVRAYMTRTGRVPVLGEYGAQDDARLPLKQRFRYYHTISAAFASQGIQSCTWGYRSGFKLRDGDHWIPGGMEAIATTAPD